MPRVLLKQQKKHYVCTKFWTTFHFLLKNSHDIRNQWKNFLGSNLRWCVSWQIESVPPSVSQLRAAIHFWLSRFECCCGVAWMNIWSNRGTFYTFHSKLTSVIKNTSFLTYAKSASSSSCKYMNFTLERRRRSI